MYQSGRSLKETAAAFDVKEGSIRALLINRGIARRRKGGYRGFNPSLRKGTDTEQGQGHE
jgi:hypothetical protein